MTHHDHDWSGQILEVLKSHTNRSTRELAVSLGTIPSNITRTVKDMLDSGLIKAAGYRDCEVTGEHVRVVELVFRPSETNL